MECKLPEDIHIISTPKILHCGEGFAKAFERAIEDKMIWGTNPQPKELNNYETQMETYRSLHADIEVKDITELKGHLHIDYNPNEPHKCNGTKPMHSINSKHIL